MGSVAENRFRNSTGPKSRHVLGTDQYIAPEAYEGEIDGQGS